jgi:hypothetical protein
MASTTRRRKSKLEARAIILSSANHAEKGISIREIRESLPTPLLLKRL